MSVRTALSAVEIAEILGRPRPTDEQVAVIEAPLEPLLVVAGAGSGKTETMAARVVFLVANGLVEPERVLGLTFTRKAAGELAERVRHRLRDLRRRTGDRSSVLVAPTIATYNSYAAGLVGDHALRVGVDPSARVLGEAARWQIAHDVVEQWSADLGTDLAPSTVTEAVLDLAGELAEHLHEPAALRAEAERLVEVLAAVPEGAGARTADRRLVAELAGSLGLRARLVDLVEAFVARKREEEAVDFADQVALAARLAREVPEVGAGERARYGVVLLDEYQDTSVAQLQLLRCLFGGGSAEGTGHPVTAVGDPHQSIYGWRGASAAGLAAFPEHFPRRGPGRAPGRPASVLALATSWRNDDAVLAAANLVAAPLRTTGTLDLPVLAARPGAGAGHVSVAYLETQEDEARAVAEAVRAVWSVGRDGAAESALGTGTALGTRGERDATGAPAGPGLLVDGLPDRPSVAVLCRKRSQFPGLQAALVAQGVPVEVVGLGGLLTTPEVVDLVAALEAAHDPSRGDSLMRLLTGPRLRLGLADLHALGDWTAEQARHQRVRHTDRPADAVHPDADVVDDRSVVDALDDLPWPGWVSARGRSLTDPGRRRLVDLAEVLRAIRAHAGLPVVDLVAEAERLLGLDIEVTSRPGLSPAGARANLDAFRTVAATFTDSSETGTLGAFLAWLDAAQREERGLEAPVAEVNPDAVQILTVHAAKGLEWDAVAVPGLVDGGFPSLRTPASGTPVDPGWLTDRGALPDALRGDRDALPTIDLARAVDVTDLADRVQAYRVECGAHQIREERRLAYVALTRARHSLLLTGSWWRDGTTPRPPSVFLTEIVEGVPGLSRETWAPDPSEGVEGKPARPPVEEEATPVWPAERPLGDRHTVLESAASAVLAALEDPRPSAVPEAAADTDVADTDVSADTHVGGLSALADLLLDEQRRGAEERGAVTLPAHLSASALVRLSTDPAAFAMQLRRPVPSAPSVHARRGTAFHSWVESWYGSAALVDLDSLPGADDDADDDLGLEALRATFLASEWADRTPLAVEVDVETPVGEVVVRSRIDAVFPDPVCPGGVVVVDWKTGRPPTDPEEMRHREVQLAVYRLAWSRWAGVPLDTVSAAFVHVSTGQTVRPARLLDAEEIEALLSS